MTQFGYCSAATARRPDRGSALCGNFFRDPSSKFLQGYRAQITRGAATDGHLAAGRLFVAYHKHVGAVSNLRAADLIAAPLIALIEFDAPPSGRQAIADLPGIVEVAVCNRQHAHLLRRQPDREVTGVVLDEKRHHPLHRADDGPVDHHRTMCLPVLPDKLHLETLAEQEIELHRGEGLVFPRSRPHLPGDVWPAERRAANHGVVWQPQFV